VAAQSRSSRRLLSLRPKGRMSKDAQSIRSEPKIRSARRV
jgi:hypothetical protein